MIHTTTNGRLTAPPEPKTLESGSTVCELRIATDGRNTDDAEYLAVSVWGRTGEACAEHLAKGQAVTVSGPLTGSAWTAATGIPATNFESTLTESSSARRHDRRPTNPTPVKTSRSNRTGRRGSLFSGRDSRRRGQALCPGTALV